VTLPDVVGHFTGGDDQRRERIDQGSWSHGGRVHLQAGVGPIQGLALLPLVDAEAALSGGFGCMTTTSISLCSSGGSFEILNVSSFHGMRS